MPNPTFLGYLTEPYLEDQYGGDTGLFSFGTEVKRIIADKPIAAASEVSLQIVDKIDARGAEVQRTINGAVYAGSEVDRLLGDEIALGAEANLVIADQTLTVGAETALTIPDAREVGSEVHRSILNLPDARGGEVNREIMDFTKAYAFEIRRDKSIAHWLCEGLGYLQEGYLEDPYLAPGICAQMGAEALRRILTGDERGTQAQRIINARRTFGSEVNLRIVDMTHATGAEIDRLQASSIGLQTRLVLYNTNRLRVLCDFPSRGSSGVNWTASSTASGDFSPNNLNTDIVEQVYRSTATAVVLTCDTEIPQGTSIDTMAILNHNLTTSASVTVEGSDNPTFSPVEQSFGVEPQRGNAYYIAPVYPTQQSRYWRVIINDPTNPAGYIQAGTIVFGNSVVFQGECFTDRVTRRMRHFSDKVSTEGFTNVSNDRALKTAIGLEFRYLRYQKGNYRALRSIFEEDRTTIKCLWIPDPQEPERFGVFGKLVQIPDEVHMNLGAEASDTVDLNLEIDESL